MVLRPEMHPLPCAEGVERGEGGREGGWVRGLEETFIPGAYDDLPRT